jgi:hypothetical protein
VLRSKVLRNESQVLRIRYSDSSARRRDSPGGLPQLLAATAWSGAFGSLNVSVFFGRFSDTCPEKILGGRFTNAGTPSLSIFVQEIPKQ